MAIEKNGTLETRLWLQKDTNEAILLWQIYESLTCFWPGLPQSTSDQLEQQIGHQDTDEEVTVRRCHFKTDSDILEFNNVPA